MLCEMCESFLLVNLLQLLCGVTGDQHGVPMTPSHDATVAEPSLAGGNIIAPNCEVSREYRCHFFVIDGSFC